MDIVVTTPSAGTITVRFSHMADTVATLTTETSGGEQLLTWEPPPGSPRGYGVKAAFRSGSGDEGEPFAHSAVDVLDDWTQFPRYGFLCDFGPDKDPTPSSRALLAYQVNAVQFYDWQFRHDQLVAPSDHYLDPLGRKLSLASIRRSIAALGEVGIASMAYMAIYGASVEFATAHHDWALYDRANGEVLRFEDFLGLMDPTRGGPWASHLHNECRRALDFGFGGIHIDQYGDPRHANTAAGNPVDLPQAFADFVDDIKTFGVPVTMNAVKNWPIDALTASHQDFTYIEVWPDTPTYGDVINIVAGARRLASKPVVVAMYLPAVRPANIATLDAVLAAAGAWRIEVGEDGRLLADPYFPKYDTMPTALADVVKRQADFAVRYLELCGPPASNDTATQVTAPEGVTVIARRNGPHRALCLLNLPSLELRWDAEHPAPSRQRAITVTVDGVIDQAWYATPEQPEPQPLALHNGSETTSFKIPALSHLGLIWFTRQQEHT